MKKLLTLTLITALALGFNACKKSSSTVDGTNFLGNTSNTTTAPAPVDPLALVGSLPADYTKKVVLEELNKGFEELIDNVDDDTIVVCIADHGLTNVEPIKLREFPDIMDSLVRLPSILT